MEKEEINQIIQRLNQKLQSILNTISIEEIVDFSFYLTWLLQKTDLYVKSKKYKKGDDYKKLGHFERGAIVKVNFGYNIGTEKNKIRWAIVLDKYNPDTLGSVVVVPITSKNNRTVQQKSCIFVGKIDCLRGNNSYVDIANIKSISKLRIISTYGKVKSDILDKIDKKIIELYLNNIDF